MNYFYITTTLPYVNANPHLGFALEIIQADVLARYHRLTDKVVFFNTGTDEHGQKIYQKAISENKDPQLYCDEYAAKFDNLKSALNLSYDSFIRTTDEKHINAAQYFWNLCWQNGDIYKKIYKVKYCIGCELEKTDSELINGRCPLHPSIELELREEENYFFRFSKYQHYLIDLYTKYPDFVVPSWRLTEIKTFIANGLQDFSISRLKSKMPWGIEVPNDNNHVMYVWFDALINYISTLNWPNNNKQFNQFWGTKDNPKALQIAGKDNLRQQSAMWQAMLASAGIAPTRQILIHGFITSDGQKMSKSLGNIVDPFSLVEKYGTDAVRFYLLKEINPFEDGDFTEKRFVEIYNSYLANGLGNLVQRVAKMCEKNQIITNNTSDQVFNSDFEIFLTNFEFHLALESIWKQIKTQDQLINQYKPWELDTEKAKQILFPTVAKLQNIAYQLRPFLPQTAENILSIFTGRIKTPDNSLFPRIQLPKL